MKRKRMVIIAVGLTPFFCVMWSIALTMYSEGASITKESFDRVQLGMTSALSRLNFGIEPL
jgi:hypothetical protein